jgi:multicomponent K+:H+ antiporter subunit A
LLIRLDGLSLLFSTLILGIGLLVILYARYYLSDSDSVGRFYAYLLLFMASMVGVVLANNLLLLWFFWELTSISSFLLIGYWHHRSDARKGARMALTVTGAGGLALLGGIILIGQTVGSFNIDQVLSSGELIRHSSRYHPFSCWFYWVRLPNRPNFRFIFGFLMPWLHRHRSARICIRQPW